MDDTDQNDDLLTPEEARQDHQEMLWFLGLNAAFGMVLGALVAAALIAMDVGGLGTHIFRSQTPYLAAFMISAPLALTFGSAVTGSAIMMMPYRKKFAHRTKLPRRGTRR
jgi:hypothetical protein